MANDDETTTKRRPTREEGGAQQKPTRKPEGKRPAQKRPAAKSSEGSSSSEDSSRQRRPASSGGSSSGQEASGDDTAERSPAPSSKSSGSRMNTAKAAREAMSQLQELTNRDAEGIVGVEKNDDGGWTVIVEVVESRRIPDTADVLAEYSVTIDSDGDLTAYSREARYVRGRTTRGE